MTEYRVTWTIDVEADSPIEAAKKAQEYQQMDRPEYWVGVFDVTDKATDDTREVRVVRVDLDEDPPEVTEVKP